MTMTLKKFATHAVLIAWIGAVTTTSVVLGAMWMERHRLAIDEWLCLRTAPPKFSPDQLGACVVNIREVRFGVSP